MLSESQSNGNSEEMFIENADYEDQSTDINNLLVRRAEVFDSEQLEEMIKKLDQKANMILLFDQSRISSVIETAFLSVVLTDANDKIYAVCVFNDFPAVILKMVDFKHENLWEHWFQRAFINPDGCYLTSFNTLWMTYYCIDDQLLQVTEKQEGQLVKKIFQHVYGTLPHLENILYLFRGKAVQNERSQKTMKAVLNTLFIEVEKRSEEILRVYHNNSQQFIHSFKAIKAINYKSCVYYSHISQAMDVIEIRQANQQDHDDLARIFDQQSQVLTEQFGEFFIAELIAAQNHEHKALVAQVEQEAIGLMSLSIDIDYQLLAANFELEAYDNLFISEFMQAIRNRHKEIIQNKKIEYEESKRILQLQTDYETKKCRIFAQRMAIQEHCIKVADRVLEEINEVFTLKVANFKDKNNDKLDDDKKVHALFDSWLNGYQHKNPSDFFFDNPTSDPWLVCNIQTPRDFLMETLEFFGLPEKYMKGNKHWTTWAKRIQDKRKMERKRMRPQADSKKRGKRRRNKKKEAEEMVPPKYFDLQPFLIAFKRFIQATSEVRTEFRRAIKNNKKVIDELFSDDNGVLIETRCVDIITIAQQLEKLKLEVPPEIHHISGDMLRCFGAIKYTKKVLIEIIKKEEVKEDNDLGDKFKKQASRTKGKSKPKEIKVTRQYTNRDEFLQALHHMKMYDFVLSKMEVISNKDVKEEMEEEEEKEEKNFRKLQESRRFQKPANKYNKEMMSLTDLEKIPKVPSSAHNAISINLYCIDDLYESRGIDFLNYAFKMFPNREYIILTQPYTFPESSLLQIFTRIDKKKNSIFDHVLHIFHRDFLWSPTIQVRITEEEDMKNVTSLIDHVDNKSIIIQQTQDAIEGSSDIVPFTVLCNDNIIGLFVITKSVNLEYYKSHFCIQDYIFMNQHLEKAHTKLLHAILNPIFQKSSRHILREVCRLANKTCLYFEVNDNTYLPPIFDELLIARGRQFPHFLMKKWDHEFDPEYMQKYGNIKNLYDGERNPFDENQSDFNLAFTTKRLLSLNKISNNTRIVVVGASDTGISFIESLLSLKYINFTNITLLAPGGTQSIQVNSKNEQLKAQSTNYTLSELKHLMLDSRVTILNARMVNLDRETKKIGLATGASISYDILVIAVGLIDQTLKDLKLVSCGIGPERNEEIIDGVFSIDDPYLYDHFKVVPPQPPSLSNPVLTKNYIDMLTRQKKPKKILIYGRTLHTYTFISGLLNRCVPPERIILAIPPKSLEKQEEFKTNDEKLEYANQKVKFPQAFDDPIVEEKMTKILEELNIVIYRDHILHPPYEEELQESVQDCLIKDANNNLEKVKLKNMDPSLSDEEDEDDSRFKKSYEKTSFQQSEGNEETQESIDPEERKRKKREVIIEARLLVTSGKVDVDFNMFLTIHETGLVYNGRLIIKNNFQTTDESIFACGKLSEFSHRYTNFSIGTSLRLDKYSGREIGQRLSKSLLEYMGVYTPEINDEETQDLPTFYMPIGTSAVLPNNLLFYHIKKVEIGMPEDLLKVKKNRDDIVCDNLKDCKKGHYIKFSFDNNGLIDTVTYLGSDEVNVSSLVSLVGLSETYLNQLDARFKHGLIPNITEFLSENWALALYHEYFSEFRHLLKNELILHNKVQNIMEMTIKKIRAGEHISKEFYAEIKKEITTEITKNIEEGTVEFIRGNINHLPMYYIPGEEFD